MLQRVPQAWSTAGRPHRHIRLLIEDPDPVLALSDFDTYQEAGIDVALCAGPAAAGDCPLHAGMECPLLSEADVVLHHLPADTGVLEAIQSRPEHPPLVTVGGPDANLSAVVPVPSRIRAVMREAPRWIARPGTSTTV